MRTRPGFTLVELLVTIAIMGMMLALLVPMVDRSLGKNRIANDAEVFKAKIEEIRLMANSTQHSDETADSTHDTGTLKYDEVGYYAIWLHSDAYRRDHYDIVRISYPTNAGSNYPSFLCKPNTVQSQAWLEEGPCFIERIVPSKGVHLSCKICGDLPQDDSNHFLAFSAPAGQFFEIKVEGNQWVEKTWVTDDDPVIELTFNGKTATVTIDRYTAKVSVAYN